MPDQRFLSQEGALSKLAFGEVLSGRFVTSASSRRPGLSGGWGPGGSETCDASRHGTEFIRDGARAAQHPTSCFLTLWTTEHRVRPNRRSHFERSRAN